MEERELAIIGGGIAGISASIYAKRAGLSLYLFEKATLGGQLIYVGVVENYPGLVPMSGGEIIDNLKRTLNQLGIFPIYKEIEKIEIREKKVWLYSQDDYYVARSLIIATGAKFRKLNLPGEDKFLGKGISYCAVCDGFFFKDKTVAVVGGGNTACEEAIYLSQLCKKVYLIHRRDTLRAVEYLKRQILEKENIDVVWNTVVKKIEGSNFLEGIGIEEVLSKKERYLKVDGLFIAIGLTPNTEIFEGVVERRGGFILTDEYLKTSGDFIFACGDCRYRPLRQLITAAGEGAVAAMSAYRLLRGDYISS
ncbi:MAG: FAD-dependent oxidoreductase [Candidatus Omnitrophica bacterium]|nr:FAD-dependent oxidoreductase [Candidatus Omnitrophota bacterium]